MANFYGQFIGFGAGGVAAIAGAGFSSGGDASSSTNVIDKHFFASDASCTDHGDLASATQYAGGCSSLTHGYSSGGQ